MIEEKEEARRIEEKAMKIIRDIAERDISEEDSFMQSEIDSIRFVKMIVALEAAFDFEFDEDMLLITKFPHIRSLIDYVKNAVR